MRYETTVEYFIKGKYREGFWQSEIADNMIKKLHEIVKLSVDHWYDMQERFEKEQSTPPPKVEISLEDAKGIYTEAKKRGACLELTKYKNLKEAISKAESIQEDLSKRGTILDNRNPIQKIQDQVNELRSEIDSLKNDILRLYGGISETMDKLGKLLRKG